jgi:iron complex transport system substrate-binding protein
LVGRGEYCNYPAEVLEVPSVQSGMETNLEQIIALKPDLVIMAKMAQPKEQADALVEAGIPVAVTDAADIAGTYKAIELIGTLTGKQEQAAAVVADMQIRFDALREKVAGTQAEQTVYFEVSPLQYGLWTAGQNTFMQEIAQVLGLKNAFEDVSGWAEVSQEQVLARDPDYIVTVAMYFGEGPTPQEEIVARAGWDKLKAVQNNHVILLDSDEISRPGPRLIDAAEHLYEMVYGEQQVQPAA